MINGCFVVRIFPDNGRLRIAIVSVFLHFSGRDVSTQIIAVRHHACIAAAGMDIGFRYNNGRSTPFAFPAIVARRRSLACNPEVRPTCSMSLKYQRLKTAGLPGLDQQEAPVECRSTLITNSVWITRTSRKSGDSFAKLQSNPGGVISRSISRRISSCSGPVCDRMIMSLVCRIAQTNSPFRGVNGYSSDDIIST